MICLVVMRYSPPGSGVSGKLWSKHVDVAPLPQSYITNDPASASLWVDKVEFDYSTSPNTVTAWVR